MSDNTDFDVIGDGEQCEYCGSWPFPDARIATLEHELSALREQTRWIPVTEQLPSDDCCINCGSDFVNEPTELTYVIAFLIPALALLAADANWVGL